MGNVAMLTDSVERPYRKPESIPRIHPALIEQERRRREPPLFPQLPLEERLPLYPPNIPPSRHILDSETGVWSTRGNGYGANTHEYEVLQPEVGVPLPDKDGQRMPFSPDGWLFPAAPGYGATRGIVIVKSQEQDPYLVDFSCGKLGE